MKIVVFGLTISSAWGNGHATLWRGLCRALHASGHRVVFFERDVPYYAWHRDDEHPDGCDLRLYADWSEVVGSAERELADADVGMVTSYCPDGREASDLVLGSAAALKTYYDLDTAVTLDRLARGDTVPYLPDHGLGAFDIVLSFTGGRSLDQVRQVLGARAVAPLYGSVDPDTHRPVPVDPALACDVSYLGTYASDRQDALQLLFIDAARRAPARRFTIAGSMYPQDFPWAPNIYYLRHMPPGDHPAFYCSSRLTLNITRRPMAEIGYCPSGRLFEAAACGTPILSDWWEGLDEFFTPGREILIATTTEDTLAALEMPRDARAAVARAARERVLECHTAAVRARELEQILDGCLMRSTSCGG